MVDIYAVLEKLEDMGFIRTHKRVGNYMQIFCPFHNDGNERKPSCGVLLHEEVRAGRKYPAGWCHCFTCGFAHPLHETVTELLKLKHISQTGMEWLVANIPGFDPDSTDDFELLIPSDVMDTINEQYAISYIQSLTKPKQQYVSEEELTSYRFTVPYMYERKLTDEIIEKFDVGYDANWIAPGRKKPTPCITFPVKDTDGNTLFLCRRSIQGKFFNYPTGVTKPVYGIDKIPDKCKSIIICESIINCLTCWTWGYVAVALLGTGNSFQIQQLKELGTHEFVICMDGDEAGRKATEKLKKALKNIAIVWSINMPPNKDVNDCSQEEFDELYKNRE